MRYEYVVDQQPLGKLLFDQWCEQKGPAYHRCLKFLDAAKRYEVETDEQRLELANSIKKEFLLEVDQQEGITLPEVSIFENIIELLCYCYISRNGCPAMENYLL